MRKTFAVIIFLGLTAAPSISAQTEHCKQRTISVVASNPDGSPLSTLDRTNFVGTYRKTPLHIVESSLNHDPIRVVLLLDVSGSIGGVTDGRRFSLGVAENLLQNMPPETAIGLAFFYSKLIPISPPTTDRKSLIDQVQALYLHPESYRGKTALWDALIGGARMFDHPRLGDVIYLVTDGGNNAGNTTLQQVIHTLGDSGIRLSGVVFRSPAGLLRHDEESLGPPNLDQVARETGGTILTQFPPTGSFIPMNGAAAPVDTAGKRSPFSLALDAQYLQLTSFYRISFDLPEALHKPEGWKLELAGMEESQRKTITLTYPHTLATCQ